MPRSESRLARGGSGNLFRGYELTRLVAGILVLGIVGLFYFQARNPKMWTGIAGDDSGLRESEAGAPAVKAQTTEWKEQIVPIPESDGAADPAEKEAFAEEAQAIVDKKPLSAEEMASYWRLVRWARAESTADLEKRARRDLLFTHLAQDPAKYRGELVRLRLHVKRVLQHTDVPKNSADTKELYEAWGVTDDSQSNPYCVLFPEKPPQLKVGPVVFEEATFVGFFHKLMLYEDTEDNKRYTPLLIGRLTWIENPVDKAYAEQSNATWWIFAGVFALVTVVVGTQWWSARTQVVRVPEKPVDEKALNRWLETGEIPEPKPDGTPDWLDSDDPPAAPQGPENR